jgi:glycosyltransferase involved in cell wall biosynthesis
MTVPITGRKGELIKESIMNENINSFDKSKLTVDIVFITYNRLEYARLSLPALLADPTEEFSLTIWDNGSTDGTREFLSSVDDPRIIRKVFSKENVRLHGAINQIVRESSADLLGVVLDDLLVAPGWTHPLVQAHADVPEMGMLGCWHLAPEEFDYKRAMHKIQKFGRHEVLRHPWGGVPYLIKLKTLRDFGPLQSSRTTGYWIQMALKGYVNGHYVPPIHVDHMDYPWSKHFAYPDKFQDWLEVSSGAKAHGIRSLEDARAWHQVVVSNILDDPWQAKYYVGWRAKVRNARKRIHNILKS